MKRVLKIAGVGVLALLALVFVLNRQATATEGPGCAPTTGFIPQFCVNMPVGTSVRHETNIPLSAVLTARADVRVESGVPAPEVIRLATSIDNAITRVELAFGRPFTTTPRILVFATRESFSRGTRDLFGYSPETASNVAASYGGVFDPETLTIAVNWQAAAGANLATLLAHELTHLATREIVGQAAVLPAWFEEGLAAEIEAGDTGLGIDAQVAARSLLANAPRTLDTITTLGDWHRAYAEIGVALYAVSAETVRAIELASAATRCSRSSPTSDAARRFETPTAHLRRTSMSSSRSPVTIACPDGSGFGPSVRQRQISCRSPLRPNATCRGITGNAYDIAYPFSPMANRAVPPAFGSTAPRARTLFSRERPSA